ncbi:sigma-70 family RNA polymerase sigma factor [Thomasclavelia cocleata]|uniref:sigma-70 family RNA polymerase sigma factor n=1 Tax=Thomasclavelia cocleata TaxID=69824 RepID=UPI00255B2DCE|nr:sigma-70 family RNA polymerase sigma factor [Thomasclavelia cocleata]
MNNYQVIINGYHEPKKRLTTKETYVLIDQYQTTKDPEIKEKLVNDNAKLVISMTKRFYGRSDSSEDLFQVGMIGLLKAIENFDTSYGLKFSTYAVPLIIGEMKRYLRDNHQIKISRSIRDLAYKVLKVKDHYLAKY